MKIVLAKRELNKL